MKQVITEQEETLLILKWGENYRLALVEIWFNNNDADFTPLERNVVFNWVQEMAEFKNV